MTAVAQAATGERGQALVYDPKIATVSEAEFLELLAIFRSEPDRARPLSDDDRWRRDYVALQAARRVAGEQADLFGARTTTHYNRLPCKPKVTRPPQETLGQKLDRIRGDPNAAFGPRRTDRPAFPTRRQRDRTIRTAANWLHVRQRVRIADAPGSVDPAFGPQRFLGREGVIWRLCSGSMADHVYVFLDPVRGERVDKIRMVEVRDIEPIID